MKTKTFFSLCFVIRAHSSVIGSMRFIRADITQKSKLWPLVKLSLHQNRNLLKIDRRTFRVSIQEYINFWISFDDIGPVVTKHHSVHKSFLDWHFRHQTLSIRWINIESLTAVYWSLFRQNSIFFFTSKSMSYPVIKSDYHIGGSLGLVILTRLGLKWEPEVWKGPLRLQSHHGYNPQQTAEGHQVWSLPKFYSFGFLKIKNGSRCFSRGSLSQVLHCVFPGAVVAQCRVTSAVVFGAFIPQCGILSALSLVQWLVYRLVFVHFW